MIKIERTGKFEEMLSQLIGENMEIADEVAKKIKLFQNNPEDTRLENHALRKQLEGKYAFSVTGDIRIVYEWKGKTTARFLVIGPHRAVYLPSLLQN